MEDKRHSLSAFTILEVTIVMLVSAIVIGITYESYNVISKLYVAFKLKNEQMAVLARVDQLFHRDFDEADFITANGEIINIKKETKTNVSYEFANTYIIRRANIIDTFKINNDSCQVFFEKQIKPQLPLDTGNAEDKRIDELSFVVAFQGENILYHYYKQYSSENLIQRNPNAIN